MNDRLYNLIKESVRQVLNEEDIKKGDVFRMDVPERMARKILAQKYGVNPNDFKYDGFKTYTYTPKRQPAKKKEFLGRGEDETHEEYANRVRQLNKKFTDAENAIEGEEWRPLQNTGRYFGGITDYTKSHEISNMGRIRIIDYTDPMRSKISAGYDAPTRNALQFHLDAADQNGKSFKTTPPVHTMVADTWLPKPVGDIGKYDVIHIDGDYRNNRADNLRYVLRKGRGKNNENNENIGEVKMRRTIKNESINKMLNLLSRIDKDYKMLVETKLLTEDKQIVKNVCYDPGQFIDFLESLGDATIINVAIVQAGDLGNIPKVKRKNPATNRMKTYNDYSSFNMEGQEDVAAIAKVTRYNIMYRKQDELNKEYTAHKQKLSDVNVKYGLNPIGDREGYKEKTGYGNETRVYKGGNQDKQGTLYLGLNTARVMGQNPVTAKYYLLDANGNIVGKDKLDKDMNPTGAKEPMGDDVLSQYPPIRKENSYVQALRKMGKDETIIKQYIEDVKAIGPMKYRNPTFDHILWCCATPQDGGESSIFVNKKLSRNIDGVDLNPAAFEAIVKGIYSYSEAELNNLMQQG